MKKDLLKGIRVLDITQAYSGPFCTMHLADHGAEVIKVESLAGEQSRYWPPYKNDYSGYYAYLNRNKKGIALDLKSPEGKEALERLIKVSDVVVENFKVGTFARLGFPYEHLKELNPRIIYASVSGYGLEGPLASRPSYDLVAQAESGLMSLTGRPEEDPTKVGPAVGDSISGTYLSLGIMMALFDRERTGEGARVDVAMLDCLFSFLEENVMHWTINHEVPKRTGNYALSGAPWDSFKAKDGQFVIACGTEALWQKFCDAVEHPEWKEDPDYLTIPDRFDHYLGDLRDKIEAYTLTKTLAELEDAFVSHGVPFGVVRNVPEVVESEQIARRNMLWKVFDPGFGEEIRMPGSPIKVQGESDDIRCAAPTVGQDNDAILTELAGFSADEVKAMREKGSIA